MEKPKIEELKAAMYWLALNYQQNFYEISSDWNKYNLDEHIYLKNYIGYALYGPPEFEEVCDDSEDGMYLYKEKGCMELIDTIYNKIVEHGTQMTENKEVLCSILYTCMYEENSLVGCDEHKLQELIFIRPIFKIQKNIKKKNDVICENWYVDTESRVYKSWKDFLSNNNMPPCTMIAPKDGIYQADLKEVWSDKMSSVCVEVNKNNSTKKITNAVDWASTVVNFGCVGIGIVSVFNPISAPIAIAGVVGGVVSGAWGGGRAIGELVDRGTHDQSISIVNRHALPAWLGVAGSTLGLAASSGSALLSRAIRTGTSVGRGAQIAHDCIMISNLFVNTVGVGYNSVNIFQKYRESGEVSAKDVFFLTAHVLFVCNSAVKMRLASEIIKTDQNQILKDYEDSLRSNRHKKEFRRLVRNTGSQMVDEVHRNEQIIRTLTKINNRDEFFATMVQNRKLFASTGTTVSFVDGHVQVNGVALISPSAFVSMTKESMMTLVNQASGGTSTTSNVQTTSTGSSGRTFISANALKAGASALKDFYVAKSVSSSTSAESHTSEYNNILNDIQNLPEKSRILQLLLETGHCIMLKVQNSTYTVDHLLSDATNFVWQVIKMNFASSLPGISMFEAQYHDLVMRFVQATHDFIKANASEWANAFRSYVHEFQSTSSDRMDTNEAKTSKEYPNKDVPHYNDMALLDPIEVLTLPTEISTMVVQEALDSTGSQMNNSAAKPSKEMLKMCEAELSDFFSKHPTSLDFKITDLPNEFKGILSDLQDFEKKNIIFYKLLIISINITQGIAENENLKKDVLVDVMKCLWIFVNMNFHNIMPETCMFSAEYESFVMNIIIALYRYQIYESDKWSRAFHEYRCKYGKEQ